MMVQWASLQWQSHCVYLSLTVKPVKDTSWVLVPSCHIGGIASQACPLHLASRAPEVFTCCTLKLLFVLVGVCVVLVTSSREVLFTVLILLATWISLKHQATGNTDGVCVNNGEHGFQQDMLSVVHLYPLDSAWKISWPWLITQAGYLPHRKHPTTCSTNPTYVKSEK